MGHERTIQRLKLTGAAILFFRASTFLQVPAAQPILLATNWQQHCPCGRNATTMSTGAASPQLVLI
jgi:hypothetical protein